MGVKSLPLENHGITDQSGLWNQTPEFKSPVLLTCSPAGSKVPVVWKPGPLGSLGMTAPTPRSYARIGWVCVREAPRTGVAPSRRRPHRLFLFWVLHWSC